MKAIVAKLVEMAKGGDLRAMKEVLDRTLGKPVAAVAIAIGDSCEGCPAKLTPEEVRARLAALDERLGLGTVNQRVTIEQDSDWYGTADRIAAKASASGENGPCE